MHVFVWCFFSALADRVRNALASATTAEPLGSRRLLPGEADESVAPVGWGDPAELCIFLLSRWGLLQVVLMPWSSDYTHPYRSMLELITRPWTRNYHGQCKDSLSFSWNNHWFFPNCLDFPRPKLMIVLAQVESFILSCGVLILSWCDYLGYG